MGRKRKSQQQQQHGHRRLPRGNGSSMKKMDWYDLNVPTFHHKSSNERKRKHLSLMERFQSTGYSAVAFSHSIYGGRITEQDASSISIPLPQQPHPPMTIFRRLNIVVEEVSHLQTILSSTDDNSNHNHPQEEQEDVIRSYDLVALSPQNDAVMTAACASSSHDSMVDIIMLDYTCGRGGVQLPYKLKRSHIVHAVQQNIVFELPYAPAIVNVAKRKAFIQTIMTFHSLSIGLSPKLILSSGSRLSSEGGGNDWTAMALRTPGDLLNLLHTICGFPSIHAAKHTLYHNPLIVLQNANHRKTGKKKSQSNTHNNVLVSVDLIQPSTTSPTTTNTQPPQLGEFVLPNDTITKTENQKLPSSNNETKTKQITHESAGSEKPFMTEHDDEDDEDDSETGEGFIRF